jgi:hypothetical protein
VKRWGGRQSIRLVALTLATKGDTCHLCGMPGADSADHDPARSQLLRLGVRNPDLPEWLWPAHLTCNHRRRARPLDDALRAELHEARLHDLGLAPDPTAARLSPAIAARRPRNSFESA